MVTTRNLKWVTTTYFENVTLYEDIDHDLNFYGQTKLLLLTIHLPKIQKCPLRISMENDFWF